MDSINDLKTRLIVLEIAVQVLYGHMPQHVKDELADIGNEYLDRLLALPI